MNKYTGHSNQLFGVEEYRLVGGKKDGMRFLKVRNGKGLELEISLDRCADISRVTYFGYNIGYMACCDNVHPSYYNKKEFLKSFNAGFLTTCGLNAVGSPCVDNNEELPLHGTISNTPVDRYLYDILDNEIIIKAIILDECLFSYKLSLTRIIRVSLISNEFVIEDEITNTGDIIYPVMILYHINIGYPLLSESSKLYISSNKVEGRNEYASQYIEKFSEIHEPLNNYEEQCFYHYFDSKPIVSIFNKEIDKGLIISYDNQNLKYFTEWKMLGVRDYVLGLEPGNCHPDGRDKMRKEGSLIELKPNQKVKYQVNIKMMDKIEEFNKLRKVK